MPRDEAVLLDVVRAILLAQEFVDGMTEGAFLGDVKTQSAVLHQLLVIGEAVKRRSTDFKSEHPQVPWKLIDGMRDKLIHGYDDVDPQEVWMTIARDLPSLSAALGPIAPSP